MKKFKEYNDLTFTSKTMGGTQARLDFDNGYGVSVITGFGAYGGNEGLYELAVFKKGSLCYDTSVTNDVLGYLKTNDVSKYMRAVQKLEKVKED